MKNRLVNKVINKDQQSSDIKYESFKDINMSISIDSA
jgi:hypothetical protein